MARIEYTYNDADRVFYERVWDVLVAHGGAYDGPHEKETFVRSYTQNEYKATEYRFGGDLGFGGKFYRGSGRFYVLCYREDQTPEREQILKTINEKIAELVVELNPSPY